MAQKLTALESWLKNNDERLFAKQQAAAQQHEIDVQNQLISRGKSDFVWDKSYIKTAKKKAKKRTKTGINFVDRYNAYIDMVNNTNSDSLNYLGNKYNIDDKYNTDGDYVRKQVSDVRQEAIELSKQLEANKDDFINQYGIDKYNEIAKSLKKTIKNLKVGGQSIVAKRNLVNFFKNDDSYKTEEEKSKAYDYFNNVSGYYGQDMTYEQVETELENLKSDPMRAVKDPYYKQKVEYLENYQTLVGYKNDEYSKKYLSGTDEKIKQNKKDRKRVRDVDKTDENFKKFWIQQHKNEIDPDNTNDTEAINKIWDNLTFSELSDDWAKYNNLLTNSQSSENYDKLSQQKKDFEKMRNAYVDYQNITKKYGKVEKNPDFDEKTENVDYDKFFPGFKAVDHDRALGITAKDDNTYAWYNYVAKNDRLMLDGELYNVNLNALSDEEKKLIVYYIKKIGENDIDKAIAEGKVTTDGTEESKLAAEQELKAKDTTTLINYIRSLKKNKIFKDRNDEKNYESTKYSSTYNKVLDTFDRILFKIPGDALATVGTIVGKVKGDIDTDSGWFALANDNRRKQSAIGDSIEEEYGSSARFGYDLGVSAADLSIQLLLGGVAGSAAVSKAIMTNGAYANTVMDAKEKGATDNQALSLGVIAASAELLTEKFGIEKIFDVFSKGKKEIVNKGLKTLFKEGLKETGKNVLFEGSEEVFSDLINTTAEIFVLGKKADFKQTVQNYLDEGETDSKAVAYAIGDTAMNYLSDFAAGGILGGTFTGIGTIKNLSTYAKATKQQSQMISKLSLLTNKESQTLELAEKYKIDTSKYNSELEILETAAEKAEDGTNESANAYYEQFDKVANEFDKIRNKVERKTKSDKKASVSDSVFTDVVENGYKTDNQSESDTNTQNDSNENVNNNVTYPKNVIADNHTITAEEYIDFVNHNDGNRASALENSENGESIATDRSAVSSDVFTRLIGNKQSGYTTKMQADINEHSEDTHYVDNYKALAQVDENGKVEVNGNTYTADEYSAEYNRIYDMGLDEETPTSEIKSEIFNPEQVRQIYAAAMVDDNIARYDGNMDYEQTLSELEENEAIDRFGSKTLANIMTATQSDIKQVSDKLGLNVEFCDELPKHLNAPSGANGAYDGKTDTIYILNSDPHKMRTVFIHEVTHWLESTKGYNEFKTSVFKSKVFKKWLNTPTDVKQARYNSLEEYRKTKQRNYGNKGNEYIDQEIIATFVGDNIFSKDMSALVDFVNEYKGSQRKGIIGFIKSIFEKFKKAIKGIDKLENKFLSLVNEKVNGEVKQNKNTTKNGSVKFEINPKFTSIIDSWYNDNRPDNESFVLGSTGDVLQGLGARENDIYINSRKINTILKEHPEMSIEVIKKIPEILENPILVLASKNKTKNNTRLVMFGRVTAKNGKPALCVLDLIPREKKLVLNDMQKAVSTYSKNNSEEDIKSFFEKSKVLYTSKNKKITTNLLTRVGFSMPTDLLKSGYIGSISYENEKVNIKGKTFNEVFSYDTNNSISENAKNDTKFSVDDEVEQTKDNDYISAVKQKQLDIVLKNNVVNDDYHTWIRTKDDILTFEEALQDSDNEGWEDDGFTPDFDGKMAKQALKTGKITVYSSYPIKQGVFVTPSRMEAESYAGKGKIYESTVNLTDVAWIDATQGQYAKVDNSVKFSVDDEVDNNYSYQKLTSKPDMKVVSITEDFAKNGNAVDRKGILQQAKKSNSVYVKDLGENVNITRKGILHFTEKTVKLSSNAISDTAKITPHIAEILENSVVVNELKARENKNQDIKKSLVLIGIATDTNNNYLVRTIVDKYTNNVLECDFYNLYATKAKKEEMLGRSPSAVGQMSSNTVPSLTISISDLLENVKNVNLVNSVLSKDVCQKLGVTRSDSVFKDSLKFSIDDEFVGPNGDYVGFDEDTDEVTYLSAEDYQKELSKNPRKAVLDKKQIELRAKSLLNDFQSRADSTEVASELSKIFNKLKNSPGEWESVYPQVQDLAQNIYDNIAEQVTTGEVYDGIRETLKGSAMIWDDDVKNAFSSDWNNFIRKNRTKLNLVKANSNKGGIGIDVQYDILSRQFPGYFSGEANGPRAQLEEILDVLNSQQYVYDTFNSDNESEIINDISSEIMSAYTQIDKIGSKTDKAKAQNEVRFGADTYFDEDGNGIDEKRYKQDMRKQVNSAAADYIKEQKNLYRRGEISESVFAQRITDKLVKTSLNAKIKPLETYYKQKEKYRQRLEKVNRDISKNYNELKSRAENPTEEKYIPKELVGLVDNVVKMIENPDFDALARLEQYKAFLKNAKMDSDTTALYQNAVKSIEDQIAAQGNLGTAFAEIANRYSKLGDDKTGEQSFYCYHETVANKLQDVAEILKDTDVRNLTLRQNEALSEGLKCLTTFVKDSCKAIGLEKAASAYEIADRMVTETKNAGKHQSIIAKGINMELSPERMFRRLAGYAQDSAWEQMATMLTDGQTAAEFIKQRLKDKIAPVLEGENFKSAQAERSYKEKDLVDIGLVDENNNVVKIPRSFMLSAYMHLQAEANRNHALGGGFTVPDFRKYYKGKQQQSFDEGTRVKFNNIKDSLTKMQTLLTDYEKTMLATTSEFFNKHTKAEYNKISEEVFGFERAKVKKYFPIYSNKDFVASEFDVSFNSSLENQGNMKARQQYATNPIMLFDIYDVINRETERCGEYCGKLKAEITFKRVYNTTMSGYDTSIKEQVGKHFGESGKKYIEHLMQDYSGTRETENSVALSKLRSAVATGALMGNINVAMKQAGSYPTAAATIGWKPLLKALATNDNGAILFYRANREIIDKYTPWLRSRTEGYSTQEIADLKKSNIFNSEKTKWLFGWITASDVATVGRLWQASEYYIRDVKPELEQGTDEYYKEVAKIYNKVIFDTQPNYTVMQRPDILRTTNSLLKSMIMFSTQPLQNLGILYDAQANLNAQRKAFKAGTVDENTVKQAKREVAKGISSIVVSGITISAMTLLAKCITGKLDDYKDKYGNVNLESILKGSIGVFNSTMAGMVTFGSDIYNFISSRVSDNKYYGISVSSIDIVYDAFESLGNLIFNSDSKTIIDNGYNFVEKTALMFGFPARNLKNLVNGIYNKITTDDWFAIEASKKPSQRYGEIYEAILSGDGDRYKKAYKNAIDNGLSVNQIENGIKNILMADREDDIIEAATAQNENDNKTYSDIVDELVEAGFDENIVIGAIDTMVEKLNNDGLTDEQKKQKEKVKFDYMTELLKGVNYNGMNSSQKSETQNLIKEAAEEKAHEQVTGEAKNKKMQEAIKYDEAGVVNLVDYIAAEVLTSKKYADTNGDGKVDDEERNNAIDNANISENAKTILKGRALMGSKKIDTDNDGKVDTKFSDLSPEEQEEYLNSHSDDIDKMLEDKKIKAKISEKKSEYRTEIEEKININDYPQERRNDVQTQIDNISSAKAGEEVSGNWEAKTVNNFIDFDNSGFIDISDYVKYKVYTKGTTKISEQLDVINQLPGVDKQTKQRLKLYVAVRSKKFDADGDGKKEKYFTGFSSSWQENFIKNNTGYIIANTRDWR